jgi:hypothetical protein
VVTCNIHTTHTYCTQDNIAIHQQIPSTRSNHPLTHADDRSTNQERQVEARIYPPHLEHGQSGQVEVEVAVEVEPRRTTVQDRS